VNNHSKVFLEFEKMTASYGSRESNVNLNEEETKALDGRIAIVELQSGCPGMCLGCGGDSSKPKYHMPWERAKAISEWVERSRNDYGVDVLHESRPHNLDGERVDYRALIFSDSSDLVHYHDFDTQGIERTCWDIGKLFFDALQIHMFYTTAGWKPGDNFRQHAMEHDVDDHLNGDKVVKQFWYNIKPFGALVRQDWDKFLKWWHPKCGLASGTIQEYRDSINEHAQGFFGTSRYVKFVIENMETLNGADVVFSPQYMPRSDDVDLYYDLLPDGVKKYEYLFSREFMSMLFDYCVLEAGIEVQQIQPREWIGVGRAPAELGIPSVRETHWNVLMEELTSDFNLARSLRRETFARIMPNGMLNICWGMPEEPNMPPIPREHLLTLAEHYQCDDTGLSKFFKSMADLQCRDIFD